MGQPGFGNLEFRGKFGLCFSLSGPDLILFLLDQLGILPNFHFFRKFPLTNRSGLVRLYKEIIPMYITNITEAKAHFSALIEKVLAGEEIIIGKSGKPVAKLVRFERREESRQPGALKGKIKIADNFDELPDDIAKAFGIITD
jgi:prevent-host-death family protein